MENIILKVLFNLIDLFTQKGKGKFRIMDMSEYNLYDVPIVEGKGDIIKKLNGNKI